MVNKTARFLPLGSQPKGGQTKRESHFKELAQEGELRHCTSSAEASLLTHSLPVVPGEPLTP